MQLSLKKNISNICKYYQETPQVSNEFSQKYPHISIFKHRIISIQNDHMSKDSKHVFSTMSNIHKYTKKIQINKWMTIQ